MRTSGAWRSGLVLSFAFATMTDASWASMCERYVPRSIARFERLSEIAVDACVRRASRRGTPCPDARLTSRIASVRDWTVRRVKRRCPGAPIADRLAAAQNELLCERLGWCGGITVRLVEQSAPRTREAADATATRALRVDAGTTGVAHHLQILEGAGYRADLRNCDAPGDTLCDLYAMTAGQAFGAPSPLGVGGIPVCVRIDFTSDLAGTFDLATGALDEAAAVRVGVHLGSAIEAPCPVCRTVDEVPQLGESGWCEGGVDSGAPCTVHALAGPAYGRNRGTSRDCLPADSERLGSFETVVVATTEDFTMAPSADGPRCAHPSDRTCLCDTCNDSAATPCHTHADCPVSGGSPGVCGGLRCLGQTADAGSPCASHDECLSGHCGRAGAPSRPNACVDGVCTPDDEGGGFCASGPIDAYCAVEQHRSCAEDVDCPLPGDACVTAPRPCHPTAIALTGSRDAPEGGTAHPTLVGGFCLGSLGMSAVDVVGGFPGPVTYTWPAEIVFD